MGVLKKLTASLALATSLFCSTNVFAKEPELKINFDNPVKSFEANSNLWYSLDQTTGMATNSVHKLAKNNFSTRTGSLLFDWYFTNLFQFGSHELSHIREAKRYGKMTTGHEWNNFIDFNPNYTKIYRYKPTLEEGGRATVAGLNQNEYNSYLVYQHDITKVNVHDALSFFVNKTYDIGYILNRVPLEKGSDPETYLYVLSEKGINLSRKEYLTQALVADLLSARTLDSIELLQRYLADGELEKPASKLYLFRTLMTPPLINHYITTNGSFYNASMVVHPHKQKNFELSLGSDIDWFGDGKVKTYRAGGKVNSSQSSVWSFSPFYYVNTNPSFNHQGHSAGLEITKKAGETVDLRFKIEHNDNDLLENIVKGEKEGFNFVFGVDVRF